MLFPNEKIIVTKNFDVHQDWDVPIPGFFIVASARGRISILDFDEEERKEFYDLVFRLRRGMKDVLGIEEVCFFQDERTHHKLFHLWIFPKHNWMNKFGEKIQSIRPAIEYAKKEMIDEKNLSEIKLAVQKMRKYFKSSYGQ
jgi:diadenosine tetraphosphate (Ap4A) HIT family hydrolase